MKKLFFLATVLFAMATLVHAQPTLIKVDSSQLKKVTFEKGDTLIVGEDGVLMKRNNAGIPAKTKPAVKPQSAPVVQVKEPATTRPVWHPSTSEYYDLIWQRNFTFWFAIAALVVLILTLCILLLKKSTSNTPPVIQHFHIHGGKGGDGGNLTVDSNNETTLSVREETTHFESTKKECEPKVQEEEKK